MTARDVISLTSVMKGHHVYNYEYEIPERSKCCVEDNNLFSRHPIVVKSNKEGEAIIGHVSYLLCKWENNCETHIRAPEGTWTHGGGIQIPCKYKIYCKRQHRQYVKNKLKNEVHICMSSLYF